MENESIRDEWCVVPSCTNTRRNNSHKIFIRVPDDSKKRKLWLDAVRRDPTQLSQKSVLFVCEDHFNLAEDMENYMQFKLTGCRKRMKPNAVPHIFDCQRDRKFKLNKPRSVVAKRKKLEVLSQALMSSTSKNQPAELEVLDRQSEADLKPGEEILKYKDEPSNRSKFSECNIRTKNIKLSPVRLDRKIDCATSPIKVHLQKHKFEYEIAKKRIKLSPAEAIIPVVQMIVRPQKVVSQVVVLALIMKILKWILI